MIMYCWFGEMLSEKASGVGEAAYASAWYNGDPSARRSLLLVLRQGQRGFVLTAGFIPVTMRTLQQVYAHEPRLNLPYSQLLHIEPSSS
ncbi:hypothetical protein R5R35_013027 [Gryllus longicercus]|uniref:Odorant receptor n=1 Tax=Gryllus longicercus TaxID=2509291 RepID=A0AAN9VFE0_9ORTH